MAEPFADSGDLQARWRTLTSDEIDRADVLLGDASNMVRERWPDVDARIEAGALMADTALRIVVSMVKRAMIAPDDDGVESKGVTTGPFGNTVKYSNPDGDLYFRAADVTALDGYDRPTARMGWLC